MTDAMCTFNGADAGRVSADRLPDAETRCAFMPLRSKAHLDLAKALEAKGVAKVAIEWEGRRVPMIATAMEARSITLRRA